MEAEGSGREATAPAGFSSDLCRGLSVLCVHKMGLERRGVA